MVAATASAAALPVAATVEPNTSEEDNPHEEEEDVNSLIIPITSTDGSDKKFIEIFPEEIADVSVSTLVKVLSDEKAPANLYAAAAVLYQRHGLHRDSLSLLQAAPKDPANRGETVRLLAVTGMAHVTVTDRTTVGKKAAEKDPARLAADEKLTAASKIDNFAPVVWVGRGMLNLSMGLEERLKQAAFFFETTMKECGPVLPGLLGMAAVHFHNREYEEAQKLYIEAIRRHPEQSGAFARVGLGLASYQLGQVDRAVACFQRALDIDPDCVEAMIGAAVLTMAGLDETATDFSSRTESAIKRIVKANMLDPSNAMVQNHLANHYFWKWTPMPAGTVSVAQGSTLMTCSQPMPLDPGELIRIGTSFECTIQPIDEDDTQYRMSVSWKEPDTSHLKVWKKDYERVFALAKGAYSSTAELAIQAESLFFLARVYHVQGDIDNAQKFYDRACKQAPDLSPARFGLAQTLVIKGEYEQAEAELKRLLATAGNATDSLALLGLLEVRRAVENSNSSDKGKNDNSQEEGLGHLRKAMELDPLNPDLVVLEALALQHHSSSYAKSLKRYQKAVELLKRKGLPVPSNVYTNLGVLCHETKRYDQALDYYRAALAAMDDEQAKTAALENTGIDGVRIRHKDNDMFYDYVDTRLKAVTDGENKTLLRLMDVSSDTDLNTLPVQEGEHLRLGDAFFTEAVKVEAKDGGVVVEIKDVHDPMETDGQDSSIFVKRENKLLDVEEATTVAFNIARLHEAKDRILAAIEIHKAITKRNPAYVSSYLRLACVAVDCCSLNECAQWLKIAAASAPGNAEVLTLIGNLHLSLCDWKPAQKLFDGLMAKKVASVEAYSALSMGNIYFANLHVSEERYAKHLQYASDYYKRILSKDPLNAYAANGIGTILAEKGEIFKAKEVFNRVREVSGDGIADALLNLGHIYLALKKHPSALQMYKSYMKRAEDKATPITSKSRADDVVDVLLYIAFAYFDWARHTELLNDANAAEADELYKQAIEHLERAMSKHTKKEVVLKYNLCMTKLQAGNCVLQKQTRNIPRTVEEIEEALIGLEESLVVVEGILKEKEDGGKVPIRTSMLEDFVKHCRANIASAQSHLEDERRRAEEDKAEQEIRRLAAEAAAKEEALKEAIKKEEEKKEQEERDKKAEAKMRQVKQLREDWEQEQAAKAAAKEKKAKKSNEAILHPDLEEEQNQGSAHGLFDDSDDESGGEPETKEGGSADERMASDQEKPSQRELFGESDEEKSVEEDEARKVASQKAPPNEVKPKSKGLFRDDSDSDEDMDFGADDKEKSESKATNKDLFGDSEEDDSDEELVPSGGAKRDAPATEGNAEDEPPKKLRKVLDDDGNDDDDD
jgi:RNA polymerase-associated protein CTR9